MLHVVVNTHPEESCAFRSAERRAGLIAGLEGLDAAAKANGASVVGAWAAMAEHTIFIVVEAPHAHAVDYMVRDAGLVGSTTTRTYPVSAVDDLLVQLRAMD